MSHHHWHGGNRRRCLRCDLDVLDAFTSKNAPITSEIQAIEPSFIVLWLGRSCPEPRTRYLKLVSCSAPTGP